MFHTIEEAIEDLKAGKIIIVVDDENRENEGDFVVLGRKCNTRNGLTLWRHMVVVLICTPITEELAAKT